MAEPEDSCIFHNKMGNVGEVTTSEIGTNLAWVGTPAYAACKFDNGIYANNQSNYVNTSGADVGLTPNNFAEEFWLKTDYNVLNGLPQSGIAPIYILAYWQYSGNDRVLIYFDSTGAWGAQGLVFGTKVNGFWTYFSVTTGLTFNSGTFQHFLWVYNRAGIGGGVNTTRFYWNGSSFYTSNVVPGNQTHPAGFQAFLSLAGYGSGASVIDNCKIYNGVTEALITAIVGNRNNEGWPSAGGGRLIDGKMIAPLVDSGIMIN